jgi:predicted kinase
MKQKKVWILSGVPGSGKSTWAHKQVAEHGGVYCSRDEIRFSLLKEGDNYFAKEDEVLDKFYKDIRKALEDGFDVIADATHITEKARAATLDVVKDIIEENNILTKVFWKDIDLVTALKRNEKREGLAKVPRGIVRRMFYQMKAPSSAEGFDSIILI